MMEKLREMEVARQEMKRKAFLVELEGHGFNFTDKSHDEFGFNDETLNMVWEMWQAAQEQMLREQAEEAAQPNAFLSAVSDVAMKLSSGDYALVPKDPTFQMYQAFKDAEELEALSFADRFKKSYKAMLEAAQESANA